MVWIICCEQVDVNWRLIEFWSNHFFLFLLLLVGFDFLARNLRENDFFDARFSTQQRHPTMIVMGQCRRFACLQNHCIRKSTIGPSLLTFKLQQRTFLTHREAETGNPFVWFVLFEFDEFILLALEPKTPTLLLDWFVGTRESCTLLLSTNTHTQFHIFL